MPLRDQFQKAFTSGCVQIDIEELQELAEKASKNTEIENKLAEEMKELNANLKAFNVNANKPKKKWLTDHLMEIIIALAIAATIFITRDLPERINTVENTMLTQESFNEFKDDIFTPLSNDVSRILGILENND